MATPDQRIAEVAVAKAAAQAAAQKKGLLPHTHSKGNDVITALAVAGVAIATLALAIWAGR